jgi:non-ribosomal peptide synthetase-like protein
VRWKPGERLEHLFEQRCDALGEHGIEDSLAVDGPGGRLSYAELDARANRLARLLAAREDIAGGIRVGLLFDSAIDGYVGMLAVLKVHGAYVPLDPGFPPDRVAYIIKDAEVRVVLTQSHLADALAEADQSVRRMNLDELGDELESQSDERLSEAETGEPSDQLCYVIYTSGTTGRPKGVAVNHASICNFVRVAAEVYGIVPDDRVYQGLTIAFDFAIEEIWVTWMVGATVVPKPAGGRNLLGPELGAFLGEHRITALCCVPTMLATMDEDLPDLRFLLVSGESCPDDLVARWHRPGRRLLNVYGPTEATVSATWAVLEPGRTVTIGVPLPTYAIVILDPDEPRARPLSQEGEIAIAGIGVAEGYLGQPDKTEKVFIDDFLGLPGNPSGRIYRTGDLGCVNEAGEVEHHGRIDTQVKIRGYRIELAEIESVLREVGGVDQAVVDTHEPDPGAQELVGYYTPQDGELDVDAAHAYLKEKLPPYEVPAYLEPLEEIPLMPSGKADRKRLPPPRGPRLVAAVGDHVDPESELESVLAAQLARVLNLEQVSVESNFFDELGASSLVMARFSAEFRSAGGDLPPVSMRDIYMHPTVRGLAQALSEEADAASRHAGAPEWEEPELPEPEGTPHYVACGAIQLATFLAYAAIASVALDAGSRWLTGARGAPAVYLRAAGFGAALLVATALVPIVAKWLLIGRFRPRRIRVWSLAYVRFWIVKTLVVSNPLARLLVGTPLYVLYLRALGARVGSRTLILSRHIPVCADLLVIGDGCVIRRETYFNGYRPRDGTVELGPVTLGSDVFVGEHSVLEINSRLDDGAQLGHASCVHAGQTVPAGECWHGSPAQPAEEGYDYRVVAPVACGASRRWLFGVGQLLLGLALIAPLEAGVIAGGFTHPSWLHGVSELAAPVISAIALAAFLGLSLFVAGTVARLLTRFLEPGRAYPLFGRHYVLARFVRRTSNMPWLTALFGDSSAITGYLRFVGYDLGEVEQSGSNFGMEVAHEVPGLSIVGTGTMVSDGLSFMNADFSSSSFRVMPVRVGERSFLGNALSFPTEARVGDNCLLGTKTMIPIAGPVRSDVGLLGSPCFEIPRSVERDDEFAHLATGEEFRRRLAAKTRHNVATMVLYLLVRLLGLTGVVAIALLPFPSSGAGEWLGTIVTMLLEVVFVVGFFAFVERAVLRFRPLSPKFCSIYQPDFWRHERYWKVPSMMVVGILNGTPFKGLAWRLFGVKVGRRLFDDGGSIVERSLVSIGDEAMLAAGSIVQCHSLEEGTFKSDRIEIGDRCTLGTASFVHYGTVAEAGAVVEADAFVMKGSRLAADARWRGNPAMEA